MGEIRSLAFRSSYSQNNIAGEDLGRDPMPIINISIPLMSWNESHGMACFMQVLDSFAHFLKDCGAVLLVQTTSTLQSAFNLFYVAVHELLGANKWLGKGHPVVSNSPIGPMIIVDAAFATKYYCNAFFVAFPSNSMQASVMSFLHTTDNLAQSPWHSPIVGDAYGVYGIKEAGVAGIEDLFHDVREAFKHLKGVFHKEKEKLPEVLVRLEEACCAMDDKAMELLHCNSDRKKKGDFDPLGVAILAQSVFLQSSLTLHTCATICDIDDPVVAPCVPYVIANVMFHQGDPTILFSICEFMHNVSPSQLAFPNPTPVTFYNFPASLINTLSRIQSDLDSACFYCTLPILKSKCITLDTLFADGTHIDCMYCPDCVYVYHNQHSSLLCQSRLASLDVSSISGRLHCLSLCAQCIACGYFADFLYDQWKSCLCFPCALASIAGLKLLKENSNAGRKGKGLFHYNFGFRLNILN